MSVRLNQPGSQYVPEYTMYLEFIPCRRYLLSPFFYTMTPGVEVICSTIPFPFYICVQRLVSLSNNLVILKLNLNEIDVRHA